MTPQLRSNNCHQLSDYKTSELARLLLRFACPSGSRSVASTSWFDADRRNFSN